MFVTSEALHNHVFIYISVFLQTAFTLPAIIAMSENSNSSQREHVIRLCHTADNNFLVVSKVLGYL